MLPSALHINDTCPPSNELPDAWNIVGIPLNVTTYFQPADADQYEAMVWCCSPNPVGLAEGCYFWCEHPYDEGAFHAWSSCVRLNSNTTGARIYGMHEAGAARLGGPGGAPKKVVMVLLAGLIGSAWTWL
ncbi:hypothetical protein PG991_001622 [Apiospora marii]|uniref:Uncharacterized protein n=1 Tax=Apiospora marii TaxID=335849 RepID=A0ABR1SRX8_9PEZI